MTQTYYRDEAGNYLGSYDGPPESLPDELAAGIETPTPPDYADQKWDDANHVWLARPPKPYVISKTTPWLRMTDDEAALMEVVMNAAPARLRQIYAAAPYLNSADELWPTLRGLLVDQFGAERSDVLLAPEA